jgi:hypothetical protein
MEAEKTSEANSCYCTGTDRRQGFLLTFMCSALVLGQTAQTARQAGTSLLPCKMMIPTCCFRLCSMSRADKGVRAAHTECPAKVDGAAEVAMDMFGKDMEQHLVLGYCWSTILYAVR